MTGRATGFSIANAEQAAQCQQMLILLIYRGSIGAILVTAIAAHGMLQGADRFGIPNMVFAAPARHIRRRHQARRAKCIIAKRRLVAQQGFLGHFGKPMPSIVVAVPVK